ncbi:hypothetical protein THUN1379_10480 [Paludibacterium sp. THUN1379]|uniref:hypothetical protein n=1 Tax=Paludibacterium sp. THUN1379 TaxID=3112107 RepID=UPI00308C90B6|nr:hypothetical protein THUN1379_10480 [Paludibacterium sp. THUN1379]
MMMQISQLQPGFRIDEHRDNGEVASFEVTQVRSLGRRVEVTFRSMFGLESAVYMADAYLNASR